MTVIAPYDRMKLSLRELPKTWLVTGSAGFIGSNLVQELLNLDQRTVGLDNFVTGTRWNIQNVLDSVDARLHRNFKFIEGDIREMKTCAAACTGVDVIVHEAALGSVPRSIKDPKATHETNVNGFLNMLIAARDSGVKRFVYASSSSVYGDHPGLPKVEDAIGRPLSPYAVSKLANELYANVFWKTYNLETVGLRYFNVFGPRQNPAGEYAAVIPKWYNAVLRNEPVVIHGDGKTTRDFCYVDNTVQATLLAATTINTEAFGQVFNVAFSQQATLDDLFLSIKDSLSEQFKRQIDLKPVYMDFRPGDIRHSLADISKARVILGYQPKYSLRDGLAVYTTWFVRFSESR